jgi:hypothetical protein
LLRCNRDCICRARADDPGPLGLDSVRRGDGVAVTLTVVCCRSCLLPPQTRSRRIGRDRLSLLFLASFLNETGTPRAPSYWRSGRKSLCRSLICLEDGPGLVGAGTVCFGDPSNDFAETGFEIGFFGVWVRPCCFGAGLFGGDPFIGAAERVDFFVPLKSSTRRSDRLRPRTPWADAPLLLRARRVAVLLRQWSYPGALSWPEAPSGGPAHRRSFRLAPCGRGSDAAKERFPSQKIVATEVTGHKPAGDGKEYRELRSAYGLL